MSRLLFFVFLFVSAGLAQPALAQTDEMPPRPTPFKFVNDEAQLMQPADAKKLDAGLRRYADNTGTQVVVVTVPSLGGRDVADYGRALGTAWGVGQRDKNNGVVVLIGAKEHKVTIQPGNGLANVITPEVTSRVINEMTPSFKQGNYFAGLRTGLNTLMVTANPSSAPKKDQTANTASGVAGSNAVTENPSTNLSQDNQYPATASEPVSPVPAAEPSSPGLGMGTLLIGALVIGGILWFVVRMFKGRSAANNSAAGNPGGTPNFLPNRPGGPTGGGYGQAQNPGNYGPGYGQVPNQSSGPGIGGMLATGAAAAAGAYLGNRMASGHDTSGQSLSNYDNNDNSHFNTGAGAAGAAGTGAASDYFSGRDGGTADNPAPDYFSDENTAADNNSDYFSSDDNNSSYDDTSSNDTGGGGFDSGNDNSGSW